LATDASPAATVESRAMGVAAQAVGLLVFLAGVAMIALVFSWTYGVFSGVDQQIAQVKPAAAAAAGPVLPEKSDNAKPPRVVIASPRVGPTLAEVSVTLLIKLVALFVLGWVASLVAARGAALATGRRGTH
jgi:hypothetical protein